MRSKGKKAADAIKAENKRRKQQAAGTKRYQNEEESGNGKKNPAKRNKSGGIKNATQI